MTHFPQNKFRATPSPSPMFSAQSHLRSTTSGSLPSPTSDLQHQAAAGVTYPMCPCCWSPGRSPKPSQALRHTSSSPLGVGSPTTSKTSSDHHSATSAGALIDVSCSVFSSRRQMDMPLTMLIPFTSHSPLRSLTHPPCRQHCLSTLKETTSFFEIFRLESLPS